MKKKTKEEWSEISFSSSEVTYYDFIVKEKDLDTIEKISNQISDLIAGGESDSTSHLVIGDLNRFNDKTLSHNHISVESSGWKFGECFDYTIENKGKLVKSPKKGEFVFLFDYVYDHADYVLTKNENFKNICFKVKSFNNRAVLVERDDPGFELTANDASDASEPGLTIICSNGLTFEGSVEDKDDLIKEFHTYLTDKRKRTSKEKDKYSLIKIEYLSIFQDVEDWDDDDEVPTQKATDYCVVKVKAFIDELKEKVDGITEERILISGLGNLVNSDLYKSKSRSILAIYNKIIEKKSFVLTDGKTAKLSFSKIAIDMEIPENFKNAKAEDLEAIAGIVAGKKPGKKKFIFTDGTKEYKITDLEKTMEFGSNQASTTGTTSIGATATTESLQCYYNALRYKLGKELSSKNATEEALTNKSLETTVHAYDKSKKLKAAELIANHKKGCDKVQQTYGTWIKPDANGQNVYTKTANALAINQPWKETIHFHRGSDFMKACYASKELALKFDKKQEVQKAPASGYSDDKWNPGDIWMSTLNPNPTTSKPFDFSKEGKSCNLTFEALKGAVQKAADNKTILAVSLKKVVGNATITEFNLADRRQNIDVSLKGFRFGQTGDFFSSTDMYLIFDKKEMQLRAFNSTKSWQGEVKGASAAGGKIGGGGLNFYCSDILNNPIATNDKDAMKWSETKWTDDKFPNFHKLYKKYSAHDKNVSKKNKKNNNKPYTIIEDEKDFKKMANGYTYRGSNKSPAFKFTKYMGLLLLEAIYNKDDTIKRKEWATKTLRYAMSNIVLSSYFIKIE